MPLAGVGWIHSRPSLQFHSVKKRPESGVLEVAESIGPETNAIDALVVYLQSTVISQAGRRGFEPRLPLHLLRHWHTSPNQLLSHLSQLDADGSDVKALKSDQSAVTASRFRASEEST